MHCVAGTPGAQLHPQLICMPTDILVHKGTHWMVDSYSAFADCSGTRHTTLARHVRTGTTCTAHRCRELRLAGVTDVYVCGLALDYCVGFSALDSQREGFRTHVVGDACRGISEPSIADMLQVTPPAVCMCCGHPLQRLRDRHVVVESSADVLARARAETSTVHH